MVERGADVNRPLQGTFHVETHASPIARLVELYLAIIDYRARTRRSG